MDTSLMEKTAVTRMALHFANAVESRDPFYYLTALAVTWCAMQVTVFGGDRDHVISLLRVCPDRRSTTGSKEIPSNDWDEPGCPWIDAELSYVKTVCDEVMRTRTPSDDAEPDPEASEWWKAHPSSKAVRQMNAAMMFTILSAAPELFGVCGDLFRGWMLHNFDRTKVMVEQRRFPVLLPN